ncbi:hypothetical protein COCON_G00184620 [Conger conger]|uniref:Centrosomal protein of 295 kDa n=1 Tax=Conger conger TaxID=82655 RepID=A0A9Q1HRI3_CONCO|nr:hypothetical protein COCON_G00184620 [Conger conger]
MKRKVAKVGNVRLRLSPNEEAQLLKEEHERRRKLRLQQVREQERCIALQIRKEVQRRRDRELQNLSDQLQEEWQRQQSEKLQALEKIYQDSLNTLGEGHRNAKENEPDLEAIAQKAEEQHERAAERHREALRVLKTQKLRQQEVQTRHIQARKKAILVEKERAAKVASLPPPSPEPFEKIEAKKPPPVKISDVDNFTVTHFHMLETAVDREEDTEQPDARRVAEEEGDRLEELAKEGERERREQLAKARLRGSHALRKEHLTQDRERLLQELAHMQHADLLRRRRAVAQMPQHALQPLYSRQEVREDRQRDLEFAFEDMYTGERRIKGDLVLQLVPEPLALSSDAHDEDLDVTLEPDVLPGAEPDALDPRAPSPPAEAQAAAPEGAPPHALKEAAGADPEPEEPVERPQCGPDHRERLFSQRGPDGTPAPRPPASGPAPAFPRSPASGPAPAFSRSRDHRGSVVAGTLPPDQSRAAGVRLAAEERRKRQEQQKQEQMEQQKQKQEQIEQQKQEQMELLERLEVERRSLELHLHQARQEKAGLQTAARGGPENDVGQEVPVREEPVPSAPAVCPQSTAPQGSAPDHADEHARRIRLYQQRLLDQNRQHTQSVGDARRRLAEYQHALKMRHSRALIAALGPAGVRNLPHHLVPPPALLPGPCVPAALSPAAPSPAAPSPAAPCPCPPGPAAPCPAVMPLPLPPCPAAPGPAGTVSSLLFGLSRRRSCDPGPPGGDPHPVRPCPTPAPEPQPEPEPEAGLGPGPQRAPPALLQGDARPPSAQSPSVDPSSPALEPLRPGQPDRASPTPPGPQRAADLGPQRRELQEAQRSAVLELQEAQRRVEAQRSAMLEQQREQEERLLLQQSQLKEQMRRHREALDSFLSGAQASESRPLESGSEVIKEERLSLMSALLRAMEESSSSPPQPPGVEPLSPPPGPDPAALSGDLVSQSDPRSRAAGPPRAPRPPVARPRLGLLEILEQHELSAIQEVETPVDASLATVGDESVEASCSLMEDPGEDPVEDLARPGGGQPCALGEHSSGSSSTTGRSSRQSWRDTLLLESDAARTSSLPQPSSEHGWGAALEPGEEERVSLPCSEERHPPPSQPTSQDSECLSSFTISTGSFSTNEPDFSSTAVDAELLSAGPSPAARPSGSISRRGSPSPRPSPAATASSASSTSTPRSSTPLWCPPGASPRRPVLPSPLRLRGGPLWIGRSPAPPPHCPGRGP